MSIVSIMTDKTPGVRSKRPREKTISRHYKRRRADETCDRLLVGMRVARKKGRPSYKAFLVTNGLPDWTTKIEVRTARLRFHYRVVALER